MSQTHERGEWRKSPREESEGEEDVRSTLWSEGEGRAALTSVSCSFSLKVWRPSRNTSGYAGTCRNTRPVTAAGAGEAARSQSSFVSARDHFPSCLTLLYQGLKLILCPLAGRPVMVQARLHPDCPWLLQEVRTLLAIWPVAPAPCWRPAERQSAPVVMITRTPATPGQFGDST